LKPPVPQSLKNRPLLKGNEFHSETSPARQPEFSDDHFHLTSAHSSHLEGDFYKDLQCRHSCDTRFTLCAGSRLRQALSENEYLNCRHQRFWRGTAPETKMPREQPGDGPIQRASDARLHPVMRAGDETNSGHCRAVRLRLPLVAIPIGDNLFCGRLHRVPQFIGMQPVRQARHGKNVRMKKARQPLGLPGRLNS